MFFFTKISSKSRLSLFSHLKKRDLLGKNSYCRSISLNSNSNPKVLPFCEYNNVKVRHRKFSNSSTESLDQSKWHQPSGTDTGIQIYNCIVKKKVPLVINKDIATWYSCGPTVYDSAHIGHASCYVKLDIIQRILTGYFGINLITCMGVTDIDDKIIKKSNETGKDMNEITKMYEAEFWKNMSDLNVTAPNIIARVTDHIPTITRFIKEIIDKNLGYLASDKSVYFDTEAYSKYGKLQKAQHREDNEYSSVQKRSDSDFALWKVHKDGEPFWECDWGNGRPGWHIECSAMASHLFGSSVDFHAGGIDLQFPHHENEEAQSCAFHGNDQWINYWIHTGHLHLRNDAKMSKSLKNTICIDELLKDNSSDVFRMACLMSHYRNSMEFSDEVMSIAKDTLSKIKNFLVDCTIYVNDPSVQNTHLGGELLNKVNETKTSIDSALRNDFDTSRCIALIVDLVSVTNKVIMSKDVVNSYQPITITIVTKYIITMMNTFGINLGTKGTNGVTSEVVDAAVEFRNAVRVRAIETKDKSLLKECDNLRNAFAVNKIKIKDVSKAKSSWVFEE